MHFAKGENPDRKEDDGFPKWFARIMGGGYRECLIRV